MDMDGPEARECAVKSILPMGIFVKALLIKFFALSIR